MNYMMYYYEIRVITVTYTVYSVADRIVYIYIFFFFLLVAIQYDWTIN